MKLLKQIQLSSLNSALIRDIFVDSNVLFTSAHFFCCCCRLVLFFQYVRREQLKMQDTVNNNNNIGIHSQHNSMYLHTPSIYIYKGILFPSLIIFS